MRGARTRKLMNKNNHKILILDNSLKSLLGFRGRLLSDLCETSMIEIASMVDVTADRIPTSVKIHNIAIERGSLSLFGIVKELVGILKILRITRPTVFVAFTIRCALLCGLTRLFYKKSKNVVVIAGMGNLFQSKSLGFRLIQKIVIYIISTNDKVIVLNKEILKILQKCNPILIEGEGVDLNKLKYSQKKQIKKFIFVGRLLRDKGIFELLDAFHTASKQYHDIQLKLVLAIDKENPERIDLSRLQNFINDGVEIIENCENVYAELCASDCFIFPSYHEGFSIALSEAAAVGLILIASDIEGCRQIVTQRNGFLVQPKSVTSILNAIHNVMALETAEIEKMSYYSRMIAEKKLDQNIQSKAFYNEIV